jgi:signal transduction histidine kinase
VDHDEASLLREPVLLARVAAEVLEQQRRRERTRSYELRIASPGTLVDVQRTWIERVIANLVGNAAKYSDPGRPVTVSVEADEGEVRLRVLDEGPGVTADEASHLFEPFYRSPSAQERAPGAGLGLAVSKRIMELPGGRIWATSRGTQGAEFGFALPLVAPDAD